MRCRLMGPEKRSQAYRHPTSNGGMQNGSSVGIRTRYVHVFARLAPICMLSRGVLKIFLHRSSGGSLLGVRCWLGRQIALPKIQGGGVWMPSPSCKMMPPTHTQKYDRTIHHRRHFGPNRSPKTLLLLLQTCLWHTCEMLLLLL